MKIGLGIGVTQPQNMPMASVGSPSYLFRDGTQGTWYDPSDINLTWRRNLLTYSEQFDNGAWPQNNITISANAAVSPDGTTTADLIYPTTTGGDRRLLRQTDGALTNGLVYTQSIYVKSSGFQWVRLNAVDATSGSDDVWFDVVNGVVGTVGSDAVATQITSAGNGWFRISVTGTAGLNDYFLLALADANNSTSATANGTSGIYIWGAQLELGSTATPYQRITDGIQDYLQYQAQPVLYRDAAGTTPVTGIEQPVGLMLDKSKGLVLGPELVDSPLSGTLGSSYTISGGAVVRNGSTGTAVINAVGGVVPTATKTYLVTFTASGVTGDSTGIRVGGGTAYGPFAGNGTFTLRVTGGGVNGALTFLPWGGGAATATYSNISVRELPGNHAFNGSGNSANFPVLSARYNLLTKTEEFDDAAWTKSSCTITPNATTAPDGTLTADRAVFTAGGLLYANGLPTTAGTYIFSGYVKSATGSAQAMRIFGNGTLSYSGNLPVTTEWTWVSFTFTYSAATSGFATSSGQPLDIYIWGADLRVANDGVNLPAYQRVNTATDYDTVGFKPYLRFNGTNQWLQTNSIDFTYGDKMFVSAGVRKLSDAASGALLELSSNANTNGGAFWMFYPGDRSGIVSYDWTSKGSLRSDVFGSSSAYVAPVTGVLSGVGDISGDKSIFRINSTQVGSNTTDQGTGNYGNYPLYIGARAGSSLWFNGRLYSLIVAGKLANAVEITETEKYVNGKTAAY